MPGDFATNVLGPLMATFIERHPAITLELDLSARRVDLIGENIDCVIALQTPKFLPWREKVCASIAHTLGVAPDPVLRNPEVFNRRAHVHRRFAFCVLLLAAALFSA